MALWFYINAVLVYLNNDSSFVIQQRQTRQTIKFHIWTTKKPWKFNQKESLQQKEYLPVHFSFQLAVGCIRNDIFMATPVSGEGTDIEHKVGISNPVLVRWACGPAVPVTVIVHPALLHNIQRQQLKCFTYDQNFAWHNSISLKSRINPSVRQQKIRKCPVKNSKQNQGQGITFKWLALLIYLTQGRWQL